MPRSRRGGAGSYDEARAAASDAIRQADRLFRNTGGGLSSLGGVHQPPRIFTSEDSMFRSICAGLLVAALTGMTPAGAPAHERFTLTSTDVHQGKAIPSANVFNGMGCTGQNLSPALAWKDAPAGTKSFAVTMYDPDAPTGSGWWHWVVYNIPATTMSLPAGAGDASKNLLPAGAVQGNTDFGSAGYGGPCPPPGSKSHHYEITVYALKVDKLDIPATATAAYVGFNLHANMLAKAELTALYKR
jgi:Raf kinase inhibitor-like YbhB/YbcL family protein